MSKKPSYGVWGIAFFAAVFACLLTVSFLASPAAVITSYENLYNQYSNLAASYDNLRSDYANTISSCETVPDQCTSIVSAAKTKFPGESSTAIEKINVSNWLSFINIIVVFVLGIFSLGLMGIQAYQYKQSKESIAKQFESDKKRERQKALEEGRRETYKSLALELVSDKDVMSDLTKWLSEYEQGEAELEYSAYIHSQILSRLMKQIHLNPIAKIGEIVAYDPNQYKTFDQIKLSEKVVVVEAGWRVGREVIKLPLVRRK